MSAKEVWYPGESIVTELPSAQPTVSEAGSDVGSKGSFESSDVNGAGATVAKSKPKITRRRIPTVDTNSLRNDSTSSDEKIDSNQCGRGNVPTTYSTIEDTGSRASTKTLLSNLMQHDEPVVSKNSSFHGWLHSDPLLEWRHIFLPKLEHHTNKNTKDSHRTRRHRSEEFIFQHYKDISEYMNYYRKHCCLTSLSVPSLKQPHQHQKPKPKEKSTGKQDKRSNRPSTQGVFRTIDDSEADKEERGSANNKQASQHRQQSPKLAELENRLNLTASVVSPSNPLPLVPRPTPPSIVNRESTSIVLCGSGSSSSERYDSDAAPCSQNKVTVVKSSTSTAEGVELPPINNCYHSTSDSSINYHRVKNQHVLPTDPFVGAEGELEDRHFHNEMDNASDPTLAASSVSIIQQPKSITKLETQHGGDEHTSSSTEESWMYPYPHFQVPSSFRYDKITREQLLSSKAHALGLLSSKNWIKSKKDGKTNNGDASTDAVLLPARIKSSPPGRIPRELHGNGAFVPALEGVNEKHYSGKMKAHTSKANCVTDTIHNRLKTAGACTHTHAIPTAQSRPIHTIQGSKLRATSSTRHSQPQGSRKQCVPPASRISHHKKQLANIHHNQQLSSSYVGQVNERLKGILKVKHENSTFIQNSIIV